MITIFSLIILAAILNASMDWYGFKKQNYGWQWHTMKVLMQGCYAVAIGFALDLNLLMWIIFLFLFAFLTGIFHDVLYHSILKKL